MYTLYGRPGTGAAAVEALLEEMGLDWQYELVTKNPDGSQPADFLKLNPLGQVPVLRCPDGTVMTESAAMMIYLADLKPGFAPAPSDPSRAAYLRWMVYLSANTYMSDLRAIYPHRYCADEKAAASVSEIAKMELARDAQVLSQALADQPFLTGTHFTALDLYAAMILGWLMEDFGLEAPANLKAYFARVKARPKTNPVFARNKL